LSPPAFTQLEMNRLRFRFSPRTLPSAATSLPFVKAAPYPDVLAPLGHAHAFGGVSAMGIRGHRMPHFTTSACEPTRMVSFLSPTLQLS
jgi:hypothetical protein